MPIRKSDGTSVNSIRKSDGTEIVKVRKGDGTVVFDNTSSDGNTSAMGANLDNADVYEPFDDSTYTNTFHSIWEDNLSGTRAIEDVAGRSGNQLRVNILQNEHYGTDMAHMHGNEVSTVPTHAYHRFMLRFGSNFETNMDGKLPGFGGDEGTDEGTGGTPSNGTGWSARAGFNVPGSDVIGPSDPIPLEYYVYHMDQSGSYGDHDPWDYTGTQFEASRDTWYEVEQELNLGTPNTNDGELRAWVDGQLVYERTDYRFRDSTGNDITDMTWVIYHGGNQTAPAEVSVYGDDLYIHRNGIP